MNIIRSPGSVITNYWEREVVSHVIADLQVIMLVRHIHRADVCCAVYMYIVCNTYNMYYTSSPQTFGRLAVRVFSINEQTNVV